jgi:hypothetical protein
VRGRLRVGDPRPGRELTRLMEMIKMGLLDSLLKDATGQEHHEDFARRYEHGRPDEGYTEQEAFAQHQAVAPNLSNGEYEKAALAAFKNMSPQQRQEFRKHINQRLGPNARPASTGHEPSELSKLVGGLHSQDPGLLGGLLGGSGMGGSIGKMALGGIAAMAIKQATGH